MMEELLKTRAEIEAVLASLVEAWNRHDVEAYCANWVEDADFVNAVGVRHGSRGKIEDELNWLHAGRFSNTTMRICSHSIRFLNADAAIVHVHWRLDGDPGMPGHPSHDGVRRGVFMHVVQRTAAGWKFVASQNTDRLPIADKGLPDTPSIKTVGEKWGEAYA